MGHETEGTQTVVYGYGDDALLGEVSATEGQRQADQARENHRKATLILQNAHRMDRNRKLSIKQAQKRRRVDWNVAAF